MKTLIISKIIIRNKTPIKSVCVCNFDFISLVSAEGPCDPWIPYNLTLVAANCVFVGEGGSA